ncbi:MAG: ribonuclease P protein component [Clostridia bacterium]|jgi:ribonuclease P protein component|nr:ribonuclease P protein component [Clostridia bacterium]MCI8944679.1 ribonuclease P protein component [Clostridia bacterium]MCI9290907.1 ribonuclease P protein component [Clostridia bacterium]
MEKKYRLRSGRVFAFLHRKGSSCANKKLVLSYAPSKYPLKVGFIVSKKVGGAVIRNKVRRRLREAFRAIIPFIRDNVNYVIIARESCADADFEEIANNLLHLMIKSDNLIKQIDDNTISFLKLRPNILDKINLD